MFVTRRLSAFNTFMNMSASTDNVRNTATVIDSKKEETKPKAKRNKKKKNTSSCNDESNFQSTSKRCRPNYFLGVQINSPEIKGKMKAIQDGIVGQDKRLKTSVVNVLSAHLTLYIMFLPDANAVNQASTILCECKDEINDILNKENINLKVQKIGNFSNKVLFVNVSNDESAKKLQRVAELLQEKLKEFRCSEKYDYKPHITLMKLSKDPSLWRRKVKHIGGSYYAHVKDMTFGEQKAASVQLLSMTKKKQNNGYYFCECEVPLDIENDEKKVSEIQQPLEELTDFCVNYSVASALFSLCSENYGENTSLSNDFDKTEKEK